VDTLIIINAQAAKVNSVETVRDLRWSALRRVLRETPSDSGDAIHGVIALQSILGSCQGQHLAWPAGSDGRGERIRFGNGMLEDWGSGSLLQRHLEAKMSGPNLGHAI
jgi:hypothetical protein